MVSPNYWVPWQAKDALIALSKLKADEIGVLIQIVNLIYAREEPIENDASHIAKLCNIQKTKCARVIERLILKNQIYINKDGKISKNRCEEELEKVKSWREKASKDGRKGADIRWKEKENQKANNGEIICEEMANTPQNQKEETNTDVGFARQGGSGNHRPYKIQNHIRDKDLIEIRALAPRWDVYGLMEEYDQRINEGKKEPPVYPIKAFLAWVKTKTRGKPPY